MGSPAQPGLQPSLPPLSTPSLGAHPSPPPSPPPWLYPKPCSDKDPQVVEKGDNGWKLPKPLQNYTAYYKTSVSAVRISLKKNFSIYSEGFEIQRYHSSEVKHRIVCLTVYGSQSVSEWSFRALNSVDIGFCRITRVDLTQH